MENEKLDNMKYVDIPFSDVELSMIKGGFNVLLYFPYERISDDKCSLNYFLPCVPFSMQGDGCKFICNGFKIYIDKIRLFNDIEYTCDVYLSGVNYVNCGYFIKSPQFYNSDLGGLMDELLLLLLNINQ